MYASTNFIGIVQNPSGTVPLLSNDTLYATVVEATRAYIKKKITLATLVDIATKISIFSGFRENDMRVEFALRSLISLKSYLPSESSDKSKINELLTSALSISPSK